jgi:hypothetical protein
METVNPTHPTPKKKRIHKIQHHKKGRGCVAQNAHPFKNTLLKGKKSF